MLLIADPEELSDSLSIKMASSIESPMKAESDNGDASNITLSVTNKQGATPSLEKGSSSMSLGIEKFVKHENSCQTDKSSNLYANSLLNKPENMTEKVCIQEEDCKLKSNIFNQKECVIRNSMAKNMPKTVSPPGALHLKENRNNDVNMRKESSEIDNIQVHDCTFESNDLNHINDQNKCELSDGISGNMPETICPAEDLHLEKNQNYDDNMEKVSSESIAEEVHMQEKDCAFKSNTLNRIDDQKEFVLNDGVAENIPEMIRPAEKDEANMEKVSSESMIEEVLVQEDCTFESETLNRINDHKECVINDSIAENKPETIKPVNDNFDSEFLSKEGHGQENENFIRNHQSLERFDPNILTEVASNNLTRDCKKHPSQISPFQEENTPELPKQMFDTSSPVKKESGNVFEPEHITDNLTITKPDVSNQIPEEECSINDCDKNMVVTDSTASDKFILSNKMIEELPEPKENCSSMLSSSRNTDMDEAMQTVEHELTKIEFEALPSAEESMEDEQSAIDAEIESTPNTSNQNESSSTSHSLETESTQVEMLNSYPEVKPSEGETAPKEIIVSASSDESNVGEDTVHNKLLDNEPQTNDTDLHINNYLKKNESDDLHLEVTHIKKNENMKTNNIQTVDEKIEENKSENFKESTIKVGNDKNLNETIDKSAEGSNYKIADEANALKIIEINYKEGGDATKLEETNNINLGNTNYIKLNEGNQKKIKESGNDNLEEKNEKIIYKNTLEKVDVINNVKLDKDKNTKFSDVIDDTELDSENEQNSGIKLTLKKVDEPKITNSNAECHIIEIDNEQNDDKIKTKIADLETKSMDLDSVIDTKDTQSKTTEPSETKINSMSYSNSEIQTLEIDDDVNMEETNAEKSEKNACESMPNKCVTIDDDDEIMLIDDEIGKTADLADDNSDSKINESDSQPEIVKDNMKHDKDKDAVEELMAVKETTAKDISSTAIGSLSLKPGISSEDTESNVATNIEPKQPVKDDSPKVVTTKEKDFVASDFIKTFKTKVCNMSKDDLEEFCLLKIIEGIADRSHLSEIKSKLKSMTQCVDEWRKKAALLTKQNRDLQIVMKTIEDELAKRSSGAITPLKITRSVGLQVLMTEDKPQKRNASKPKVSAQKMPNKASHKQTPSIPVPRLVPAQNNKSSKSTAPVAPPNNIVGKVVTPAKTPPKMPEKRPYNNVSIDLTDDEPPAKIIQKQAVRVVPPQQLMGPRPVIAQQSPTNTPKKVFIPIGGNQGIRPGQALMFKTMPPNSVRPRQPGPLFRMNGNTLRMLGPRPQQRHPAALPHAPNPTPMHGCKAVPPAPELKISKVENGIVISWKMDAYREDIYEDIASYQLYAYQETSTPPNSSLWKKIGDVKALPLPMACTLTQFMAGFKYFFAVRAVDVKSRIGPFSMPGSILLLNK